MTISINSVQAVAANFHGLPSASRDLSWSTFTTDSVREKHVAFLSLYPMSSKALSPTASLLRTSRLFALPPHLPKPPPQANTATTGLTAKSDTATAPYPTQAAIITTHSARSRGDWGLKRPLPLRSTAKSDTSTIRVHAVDNSYHVTDYASAADHVITLEKWRELYLSISAMDHRPPAASNSSPADGLISVYESRLDRTLEDGGRSRWKFAGPWLASKSEGDFQKYIDRQIRRRKPEFEQFLRGYLKAQRAVEHRRIAQDQGQLDEETQAALPAPELTDDELDLALRNLRHSEPLLNHLIQSFLDLPRQGTIRLASTFSFQNGPPPMHPAAGLSYLRTHAVLRNHPLLGPLLKPPPVQARILAPRKSAFGPSNRAKLGVAGIVVDDLNEGAFHNSNDPPEMTEMDTSTWGGGKIWVHPTNATIDAQGRIKLMVEHAGDESVAIQQKKLPKAKDAPAKLSGAAAPRTTATIKSNFPTSTAAGYGLEGVPGRRGPDGSAWTRGRDQELRSAYQAFERLGKYDRDQ